MSLKGYPALASGVLLLITSVYCCRILGCLICLRSGDGAGGGMLMLPCPARAGSSTDRAGVFSDHTGEQHGCGEVRVHCMSLPALEGTRLYPLCQLRTALATPASLLSLLLPTSRWSRTGRCQRQPWPILSGCGMLRSRLGAGQARSSEMLLVATPLCASSSCAPPFRADKRCRNAPSQRLWVSVQIFTFSLTSWVKRS